MSHNKVNEAGYNKAPVYGPSKHNPPFKTDNNDMVDQLKRHLSNLTQDEFDKVWSDIVKHEFNSPAIEESVNVSYQKQVIYNFGYSGSMSSGTISHYPDVFYGSISEFSKWIRTPENIESLFESAKENYIIPSTLTLQLRIDDGEQYWEQTVKLINVREYREYWENSYSKKWKN